MASTSLTKALAGVRVIEFAGLGPAPLAATMLADHGAEVVRIARPGGSLAPFDPRDTLSRGRADCVTLDLALPGDRDRALDWIAGADVLIEGFRPGVMERLGVGPDAAFARRATLVYGRMTGWGQGGPLAGAVGHDINYLAISGVLSTIVDRDGVPLPPQNMLADYAGGGMMLAFGIVAALFAVRGGAPGQIVDSAMVDGAAMIGAFARSLVDLGVHSGPPGTNLLDGGAPFYGVYRCADGGFVAVGAFEPQFYAALLDGLGLSGDPLFAKQMDRSAWPAMRDQLAATFMAGSRDVWTAQFEGSDACVSPVLTLTEASGHAHAIARSAYVDVGGVSQPAPTPRLSGGRQE